MELQTKALYNLLRLNHEQDPTLSCEEWQIENLRPLPLAVLFGRLKEAGLTLDQAAFHRFAEECDSPEALAELLLVDLEEPELHDRLYLVLFEIWRRLLPEKQSLSLFCDEMDHRIWLYDSGQLESDEPIQDAIANLIEILDENADTGAKPAEVFASVGSYSSHDLFSFLVDYISEILDSGNELYASELLEHFAPFMQHDVWFEFLCIRLTAFTDPVEANQLLAALFEKKKAITLDLLLEALRFIAVFGEKPQFMEAVCLALPLLEDRDEFEELIALSADYFRRRDRDDLEQAVSKLLKQNKTGFGPKEVKAFESLLHKSLE